MSLPPSEGRVLIVEDEDYIRSGLREILSSQGHEVDEAASGEEALEAFRRTYFDVAIVDIRMPGISGIEVLENIHAHWPTTAVIMLTGHATLETAMAAVRAGAYDYFLKPAQPSTIRQIVLEAAAEARRRREEARLMEIIRASLARMDQLPNDREQSVGADQSRSLQVGDLDIDVRAHTVEKRGESIHLSPTEFKLLATLAGRLGDAIDYGDLVALSLGYEVEPWEAKELIKRHVYSLRQKIEPDPSRPRYVLNVRGVGYRLASPIES
jgi:DNA-binding response OmpR family regulator